MPGTGEEFEGQEFEDQNNLGEGQGDGGENNEESTVTIPKNVYETMLAQIAEGTAATKKVVSRLEQEDRDLAAREQAEKTQEKLGRYDTAKNPTELAHMIREDILGDVQELILPVASTVMSIVVAEEVRDCAKRYDDFDKYRDKVMEIAEKNTKLSIEDAYLIAAGKNKPSSKEQGEKKGTPEQRQVVSGEKPGPGQSQMNKGPALTMRDAVKAASAKVLGNLKD